MKVTFPHFRHFIGEFMSKYRTRPVWMEMARGWMIKDKIPLSPELAILLSFIPGDQTGQGAALQYIQTKGVYQASLGREMIAKKATALLGRDVYDHEIWSKTAWDETKARDEEHTKDGEYGPLNLEKIWNMFKDEYEDEYEPKEIPTGGTGGRYVLIAALNKELVKHGFKEFHFGGPNGYIEYLENGGWAEKQITQSHMKPQWGDDEEGGKYTKDNGERHVRNGIDMSEPSYEEYEQAPGKYMYTFAHYSPQQGATHYQRVVDQISKLSQPHIEKMLSDKEHRPGGTGSYGSDFPDWLAKTVEKTKDINPFPNNPSEAIPFPEDAEVLALWIQILKAGIRKKGEEFGWGDNEIAQVEERIFRRRGSEGLDGRYKNPLRKDHHVLPTRAIFELGLKERPDLADKLQNAYFTTKVDHKKYVGVHEYKEVPYNLEQLAQNGFVLSQGGGSILEPEAQKKGFMTVRRGGERETHKLHRDEKGQWYMLEPQGTKVGKTKGGPPRMLLPVGTMHMAGDITHAPVDPLKADRIQANWEADVEAYGDEWHHQRGGLPVLKSVWDAAHSGVNKAVVRLGSGPEVRREVLDLVGGEAKGAIGYAQEAMKSLMGTYKFKFGEPDKVITTTPGGSTDEDGEAKEDTSPIFVIMKEGGISQDEAQRYIDKFMAKIRSGEGMPTPSEYPEGVWKGFLKNGFYWRKYTAAEAVGRELVRLVKLNRREKAGVGTTGGDGQTTDLVSGDLGSSQAKARIAKRGFANRANLGQVQDSRNADKRKVQTTADVLGSGREAGAIDVKMSPFRKARTAQFGKDVQQSEYESGYSMAHKVAIEHLSSLRRLAQSTPEPARTDDHEENAVQGQKYRSTVFAPLEEMKRMIDSANDKSPSQKKAVVDAICDAISNSMTAHLEDLPKVGKPDYDTQGWGAYTMVLYHAFLIDNPKYNLDEMARNIGVDDIGPTLQRLKTALHDKEREIDAVNEPSIYRHFEDESRKRRSHEMLDNEIMRRNSQVSAATPVQQVVSYGGREDEPEDTIFPMTPKAPTPAAQPAKPMSSAAARMLAKARERAAQQRAATQQPLKPTGTDGPTTEGSMISFGDWRNQRLKEAAGGPVGTKGEGLPPKEKWTFNVWGAVGNPGGTTIKGEVPVKRSMKGKKK